MGCCCRSTGRRVLSGGLRPGHPSAGWVGSVSPQSFYEANLDANTAVLIGETPCSAGGVRSPGAVRGAHRGGVQFGAGDGGTGCAVAVLRPGLLDYPGRRPGSVDQEGLEMRAGARGKTPILTPRNLSKRYGRVVPSTGLILISIPARCRGLSATMRRGNPRSSRRSPGPLSRMRERFGWREKLTALRVMTLQTPGQADDISRTRGLRQAEGSPTCDKRKALEAAPRAGGVAPIIGWERPDRRQPNARAPGR
uniref:Uncharacterized protein n=1 Tax=Candidatus Kentrum eta TaxID=2126337 RepID=A0A450UTI5_9GAMM|nr:MAG: hypothetical protein BECKH772A_GA0070896_1008411 [Candidatus Kentron sp. H]VFJ95864.1 MAG: hypothetical protein BECKH772B_GA0070898_1008312 [Candidatus Kentron sp. H]VFK02032.1 MAG: hypothetical protein BECKH772C_GA0070978_100801 [Candidatus Kentron sp. H]